MYHSLQHLDIARESAREQARQVRSISGRRRRRLVASLRRTADRPLDHRAPSRFEVLLHDRAAAVRGDLLDIADVLDRADDPDPSCVIDLERLLSDGCGSPLFNPDVHPSELSATLYYARSGLEQHDADRR